jgi:hypothetical protein
MAAGGIQVFEITIKTAGRDFLATPQNQASFALENESKALAFCAARSHIGAVR